jgi:hypothetical protein
MISQDLLTIATDRAQLRGIAMMITAPAEQGGR